MNNMMSLMPTINPNLDEMVIDGENEPLVNDTGQPRSKPTHKEVFTAGGKKVRGNSKPKKVYNNKNTEPRSPKNIKLVVNNSNLREAETKEQIDEETTEVKVKVQAPKKTYPHLVKARAKAKENRRLKALAKKEQREEEKAKKVVKSQEKKALRQEKNRQRNRENYHKKKDLKKEQKVQKISVLENQHIKKEKQLIKLIEKKAVVNGEFSYEKFAKFMFQYENDKSRYEKEKENSQKTFEEKPISKPTRNTNRHTSKAIKIPQRHQTQVPKTKGYLSFYQESKSVEDLFR